MPMAGTVVGGMASRGIQATSSTCWTSGRRVAHPAVQPRTVRITALRTGRLDRQTPYGLRIVMMTLSRRSSRSQVILWYCVIA